MLLADSTSVPRSSWTSSCQSDLTFSTSGESLTNFSSWHSISLTFLHLHWFKPLLLYSCRIFCLSSTSLPYFFWSTSTEVFLIIIWLDYMFRHRLVSHCCTVYGKSRLEISNRDLHIYFHSATSLQYNVKFTILWRRVFVSVALPRCTTSWSLFL